MSNDVDVDVDADADDVDAGANFDDVDGVDGANADAGDSAARTASVRAPLHTVHRLPFSGDDTQPSEHL